MDQSLLVRCESWGEFVALYAADVSQGGMYIVVADAPPVMSEIDVQLRLPEGHSIPLRARVVHVLDPAQAKLAGREPGIGVEFIGLDAARKQQIHQLVEFARWQGSSHNATATLASHMFEMAAPAPPSQVLSTLSEADPAAPARSATSSSSSGLRADSIRSTASRLKSPSNVSSNEPSIRSTGSELKPISPRSSASGLKAPSTRTTANSLKAATTANVTPSGAPRARNSEQPGKKKRATSGNVEAPAQAEAAAPAQPPAPPPKPTDAEQLKIGMTHLARRRLDEAVTHFQQMLAANPGDVEVTKWLHLAGARKALASNNEEEAANCFRAAISVSEDTQEARRWLRDYAERKRIEALPFGRYFVKKRPTL